MRFTTGETYKLSFRDDRGHMIVWPTGVFSSAQTGVKLHQGDVILVTDQHPDTYDFLHKGKLYWTTWHMMRVATFQKV